MVTDPGQSNGVRMLIEIAVIDGVDIRDQPRRTLGAAG